MPVLLDKPFSPGDLDPNAGEGYPHLQLVNLYHQGVTMAITVEYEFGTASGAFLEHWQRGPGSPTRTVDVSPAEVMVLWSQMPQEGESVGQAIRRVTYEYLVENGYAKGTIVNTPPLPPVEETPEAAAPADTAAADTASADTAAADAAPTDATPADTTVTDTAPADTTPAP